MTLPKFNKSRIYAGKMKKYIAAIHASLDGARGALFAI